MNAPLILREEAVFAGADTLAARFAAGEGSGKKERTSAVFVPVPKRNAVRRAVRSLHACDLGPVRLERKNGFIVLKAARKRPAERGFSLLIKEAGVYTINGGVLGLGKNTELRIRSVEAADAGVSRAGAGTAGAPSEAPRGECACAGGKNVVSPPDSPLRFSARFPLVLRNHSSGDCILKGGRKRRFSDILDSAVRSGYTGVITACDADGPAAFIGVGRNLTAVRRDVPAADARGSASSFFEVSMNYCCARNADAEKASATEAAFGGPDV